MQKTLEMMRTRLKEIAAEFQRDKAKLSRKSKAELVRILSEPIFDAYEKERVGIEKAIRSLESSLRADDMVSALVTPGIWERLDKADAIEVFLKLYGKGSVPIALVMKALTIGGVDLGKKPQRRQAQVSGALAQNRGRFIYDTDNKLVTLRQTIVKNSRKKKGRRGNRSGEGVRPPIDREQSTSASTTGV